MQHKISARLCTVHIRCLILISVSLLIIIMLMLLFYSNINRKIVRKNIKYLFETNNVYNINSYTFINDIIYDNSFC